MNECLSVLIVDDNRTNLALMDMLVRKLPNCTTLLYTDPAAVLDDLGTIEFDIAVFDYQMPGLDGIALTRRLRANSRLADRPVVIITVDHDIGIRDAAFEAGVVEFMHKPIEPVDFKNRLLNLARGPGASHGEAKPQPAPEQFTWQRPEGDGTGQRISEDEIVAMLARAAGYKDRETPMHTVRMACYCAIIAHHMGLSEDACADIRLAAPMHDIGKVGLRDEVLQKRGFLSEEERRHMAEHTRIGHAILSGARSSVLKLAAEIALTHHERWDGSGYPQGLMGEQIPLAGRIAAVADVFDALTSARPYKGAWTLNNAFNYLQEHAGEHFDPDCVAAFLRGGDEVASVARMMPDQEAETDANAA